MRDIFTLFLHAIVTIIGWFNPEGYGPSSPSPY
jgi:hypothetical protein